MILLFEKIISYLHQKNTSAQMFSKTKLLTLNLEIMKQKIIIGALALASVFAFAQNTGDSSSSETDRRPFWGTGDLISYSCTRGQQQADGTFQCDCVGTYEYHVFWIGVGTVEHEFHETSANHFC
ncbi:MULTISPECIES: hypothetical protein [Chryseobacterium]|uniref:Uncharacterized protein n=1 Tax=Candidatus Chryseobacterium massiliense TaxID=204089 RepID=A0A3D9BBZ9_9FLAO|nr:MULTISPECIES: hypothetical protein [Chryseobacterium]REC51053.1 hypothetical protein DRF68_07335 [Candidatus Chryseobacterium massiliae]